MTHPDTQNPPQDPPQNAQKTARSPIPNQDRADHLARLIKGLPNLPGIYQMLGKHGEILYVGKAKSLKNRVSSYFVKTHQHPKTKALVARIYNIQTILTRSETEALLLEQNLIKQHRPPYNVLLRDDKSYLYIFISADKPYPRLAYGRGKGNHQKGRFFGPYPSAHAAKQTLALLQKIFQMRTCTNTFFRQRKRPCLEYQIKRCKAPCMGLVSPEEYATDVENTLRFLKGDSTRLQKDIIHKMETAAANLEFEKAVFYRDQLAMISEVQAKQAVYTLKGEADVIAIVAEAGITCVHVLTVRGGQVLGGNHYFLDVDSFLNIDGDGFVETDTDLESKNSSTDLNSNQNPNQILAENLAQFVGSFYFQVSDDLPNEIILNHTLPNQSTMQAVLTQTYGKKVIFKTQVREHRAEWLEIAKLNAENALKTKLGDYLEIQRRYQVLQSVLGQTINRIECFDISHTMGEATIASCVVCDQGGLRKRDYRQYAIHGIQGGDDYAAMRQAITRRYQKHSLPDLLLIDGGKGQLNQAKHVLQDLGILEQTLLIGVAKGEGRKAGLEILHFIDRDPIDLAPDNKALHLITHIRDEAHRFAITAHRKKRDKRRASSILEAVPGLGEKRRRALLNHFGGLQQILSASQQELANVQGIGNQLAHTLYKILHE